MVSHCQISTLWYWCRKIWRSLAIGVVTLLWLILLNSTALSKELSSGSPAPGEDPSTEILLEQPLLSRLSSGDIASEKVNQFVQAYLQVLQLIEQHEGELQGAETDPEAQQVERQVEAEALSVIKTVGLTQQEYLQLLGLANVDPEFGERIAAQLQESS